MTEYIDRCRAVSLAQGPNQSRHVSGGEDPVGSRIKLGITDVVETPVKSEATFFGEERMRRLR
jgi:hypothetical protein